MLDIGINEYSIPIIKHFDIIILLCIRRNNIGNNTKNCTATVKSENACKGDASLDANINEPNIEDVIDKESERKNGEEPYLLNIK